MYKRLAGFRFLGTSIVVSALMYLKQLNRSKFLCEEMNKDLKKHDFSASSESKVNKSLSWSSFISPYAWYNYFIFSDDESHFMKYHAQKNSTSNSNCGLMQWPSSVAGIKRRLDDEILVRQKILDAQKRISEISNAREKKATAEESSLEILKLIYGADVSVNQRQEHLAKYGCAAYTEEVLEIIAKAALGRGAVELGAGIQRLKV